MSLRLGDTAPDFTAETTQGPFKFHDWIGDSWAVLFSHPRDYTPVCTTELGYVARLKGEFDERHVKTIGLSIDPVDSHRGWMKQRDDVIIVPAVTDEEAKAKFPKGWKTLKPYLGLTPQPK
jgi:thioredoxin-dependent peroxiredoxin